jgi:hypothetical protein
MWLERIGVSTDEVTVQFMDLTHGGGRPDLQSLEATWRDTKTQTPAIPEAGLRNHFGIQRVARHYNRLILRLHLSQEE